MSKGEALPRGRPFSSETPSRTLLFIGEYVDSSYQARCDCAVLEYGAGAVDECDHCHDIDETSAGQGALY